MTKTYMPAVANQRKSSLARQLFDLLRGHPQQQRAVIEWNETLAQVATEHCRDMAKRGYFGHTNPDGIGANQRLRNAGYRLPEVYASHQDANNVESLAAGDPTVAGTCQAWLNSPGHRPHVFGEDEFYQAQTQMGVGFHRGGYYKRYWCVVTAHANMESSSI